MQHQRVYGDECKASCVHRKLESRAAANLRPLYQVTGSFHPRFKDENFQHAPLNPRGAQLVLAKTVKKV